MKEQAQKFGTLGIYQQKGETLNASIREKLHKLLSERKDWIKNLELIATSLIRSKKLPETIESTISIMLDVVNDKQLGDAHFQTLKLYFDNIRDIDAEISHLTSVILNTDPSTIYTLDEDELKRYGITDYLLNKQG